VDSEINNKKEEIQRREGNRHENRRVNEAMR
jgi:hypothetical protein